MSKVYTISGCRDIGIREYWFVPKTQIKCLEWGPRISDGN